MRQIQRDKYKNVLLSIEHANKSLNLFKQNQCRGAYDIAIAFSLRETKQIWNSRLWWPGEASTLTTYYIDWKKVKKYIRVDTTYIPAHYDYDSRDWVPDY